MNFLNQFIHYFLHYVHELWFILAIGFLLSGIFYKFVPAELVERHLGEKGLRPILISAMVGVFLPVCCLGSLPIAVTLKRKGASLGAVLAFLVATPATSLSALVVCWKLLGFVFTAHIFLVVIFIALVIGSICSRMSVGTNDAPSDKEGDCCHHSSQDGGQSVTQKLKEALRYAFITLPKEIGPEILIGIALASFISASEPVQHFIREFLVGSIGYIFVLVVGLLTYVCSTASVPMADALIQSGMSHGQALCYLLVGPITSYGTILVIRKDFGRKILFIYLGVIAGMSLLAGIFYDIFIV